MRTCPRCKGSGNVGVISTLRCTSCSGKGKIRVVTDADERHYRKLAIQFTFCECKRKETCEVCSPKQTDDALLGDEYDGDATWDDGLDDNDVASLGGGGDCDDYSWPSDTDPDDSGWGD